MATNAQEELNRRVRAMLRMHKAEPGTRVRLVGPIQVNGMNVWRVYTITKDGVGGAQIGPDCFSLDEANERAKDYLDGKRSFWFGGRQFELRAPVRARATASSITAKLRTRSPTGT